MLNSYKALWGVPGTAVQALITLLCVCVAMQVTLRPALASTITVSTTTDEFTDPGDDCALREAIESFNISMEFGGCIIFDNADPDTIIVPPGHYLLTLTGENGNSVGDLDIEESMIIRGTGAKASDTVIDAFGLPFDDLDRVFDIGGENGTIDVALENLTVTGGTQEEGGGISAYGGVNLFLNKVWVHNNVAFDEGAGISFEGEELIIIDSLISDNSLPGFLIFAGLRMFPTSEGGGISARGEDLDEIVIINSTVSGNTAGVGGGIFFDGTDGDDPALLIFNSTITNNTAVDDGGGIAVFGPVLLQNSILSQNMDLTASPDIVILSGPALRSEGFFPDCIIDFEAEEGFLEGVNILGINNFCFFFEEGGASKFGVNPLLDPLADNGGPTMTHALRPGSPAIDMGETPDCLAPDPEASPEPVPLTADQRGIPRPIDGDDIPGAVCDIGAFEWAPLADLEVAKTDELDPVTAGNTVTYFISTKNRGPGPASGVMMVDTLPPEVDNGSAGISDDCNVTANAALPPFAVGQYPGASCELDTPGDGQIKCSLNTDLPVSVISADEWIVKITCDVPGGVAGSITNEVEVMGSSIDLDPDNDSDSEDTNVLAPTVPPCDTDNTPPVMTCPLGFVAQSANDISTPVFYPLPQVTDNCDTVTPVCSPVQNSLFPVGTTQVDCTATDSSANEDTCSFPVTVLAPPPGGPPGPPGPPGNVVGIPDGVNGDLVFFVSPSGSSLDEAFALFNHCDGDEAVPNDVVFPFGWFTATISEITPGGSTTLTLFFLENEVPFTTYWKFGPTPDDPVPHCYEFLFDGTTGAELVDPTTVVLHFVDGMRGDDDLTADGTISDPGGPGTTLAAIPPPGGSPPPVSGPAPIFNVFNESSGNCSIAPPGATMSVLPAYLLLPGIVMLVRRLRGRLGER